MEPYSPTLQADVTKFLQQAVVVPDGENQPHSIVFTSPVDATQCLKDSRGCCICSDLRLAQLKPDMLVTACIGGTTPFFVGVCYSSHGQRLDDFFEATARVITTCRQKTKEPQTLRSLEASLATIWPKISFENIVSLNVHSSALDDLQITIWKRKVAVVSVVPAHKPRGRRLDTAGVTLFVAEFVAEVH